MLGRNVATEKKPDRLKLTVRRAAAPIKVKRTHHQNSGLNAQPLKSAYLLKQIFTASIKFIDPSLSLF
jgi:hypothetical protein